MSTCFCKKKERERGAGLWELIEGKMNRGWEFGEVLPDTFIHYYYLAAVVVCLLIRDNPIKALKSILGVGRHTNTSPSGSGLGKGEDRLQCGLERLQFPAPPCLYKQGFETACQGLGALRP